MPLSRGRVDRAKPRFEQTQQQLSLPSQDTADEVSRLKQHELSRRRNFQMTSLSRFFRFLETKEASTLHPPKPKSMRSTQASADDLAQEIPGHAEVRKEQPIAEIVLSQENLSSEEAYQEKPLAPRPGRRPWGWRPRGTPHFSNSRNFHSQACQNPALELPHEQRLARVWRVNRRFKWLLLAHGLFRTNFLVRLVGRPGITPLKRFTPLPSSPLWSDDDDLRDKLLSSTGDGATFARSFSPTARRRRR